MKNETKMALAMICGGGIGWMLGNQFFASQGWALSCLVIGIAVAHLGCRYLLRGQDDRQNDR